MKKILSAVCILVIFISLTGILVSAAYSTAYLAAFSFSDTYNTSSLYSQYPNFMYGHKNTTCTVVEAKFMAQPQYTQDIITNPATMRCKLTPFNHFISPGNPATLSSANELFYLKSYD